MANSPLMSVMKLMESGMNSGDGTSGSTHWNNAARSRLYFSSVKDDDTLRELQVKKSNYGPKGETVRVRWQRGVAGVCHL